MKKKGIVQQLAQQLTFGPHPLSYSDFASDVKHGLVAKSLTFGPSEEI